MLIVFVSVAIVAAACTSSGQPQVAKSALSSTSLTCNVSYSGPDTGATSQHVSAGLPAGPIGHAGRWLTDASGQVLLLHGANAVAKTAPYYPCAFGFSDADASWLASNGIDLVRLGVLPSGEMPTQGRIDTSYIEHLQSTVDTLAAHHIYTLLDWHQDDYGVYFQGDGMPNWMTITNGAPDKQAAFPFDYNTNPALQEAFQAFWNDQSVPGGKGLQEYYTDMLKAVAAKFAKDPWVLGYEVMNEPWPGTSWVSCLAGNGCPALEQSELEPFYGKAAAAIRSVDPKHMIFFEPFVLYNFGYAPTHLSLPEGVVNTGLAYHQYAVNPGSAEQVFQNSIQWSKGTGGALLNTEWSNSSTLTGPPGESSISVQEGYEDTSLMPFTYWVFDNCLIACSTDQFGSMFYHPKLPPTGSNVNHNVVDSLVQPYPLAVSGTPSQLSYDPVTKKLSFGWDTTKPDGKGSFGTGSLTSFSIPLMDYPSGYSVQVTGGTSITKGSSDQLVVSQSAGVSAVSVVVTPKS